MGAETIVMSGPKVLSDSGSTLAIMSASPDWSARLRVFASRTFLTVIFAIGGGPPQCPANASRVISVSASNFVGR